MIDDAGRWHDKDDRADYVIGTVPSADPAVAHRVVLTMLGQAGNDGAASACANQTRSFRSVHCVLMAGTAARVPLPGRSCPARAAW